MQIAFQWSLYPLSCREQNIPCLPPKSYFSRFDKEVIDSRQEGLQDFLNEWVSYYFVVRKSGTSLGTGALLQNRDSNCEEIWLDWFRHVQYHSQNIDSSWQADFFYYWKFSLSHCRAAETKDHLKHLMNWTMIMSASIAWGFQVFQYPFSKVFKITKWVTAVWAIIL